MLLVAILVAPVAAQTRVTVETGDPLHIVRPGELDGVALHIANDTPGELRGTLAVGVGERFIDEPTLCNLGPVQVAAGETLDVPLPPDLLAPEPDRPSGLRYVTWQITPENGGEPAVGMSRIAIFELVGPTDGIDRDAFIFGMASGSTEWYTPELHEQMARAMGLKAVDPQNVVISTGLAGLGLPDQKRDIYGAILSHPELFDWFGYHRHGPFPRLSGEIDDTILPLMNESGAADKPIFFNETAFKIPAEEEHYQDGTIVKKLAFCWSRGGRGYYWFCPLLRDSFRGKAGWDYHLFYEELQPRPGVLGYNTAARELRGRAFHRQLELRPDQWAFLWTGDGDFTGAGGDDVELLLWDEDELRADEVIVLEAQSIGRAERIDLAGNVTPLAVKDGRVLVTVAKEQAFVRLTDVAGVVAIGGSVVRSAEAFVLAKGETREASIELRNPLPTPQSVEVEWTTGDALAAVGPTSITVELPANAAATAALPLRWLAEPTAASVDVRVHFNELSESAVATLPVRPVQALTTVAPDGRAADFSVGERSHVRNLGEGDPERQHLTWSGPDDAPAQAWLWLDGNSLRLRFEVVDDVHFLAESPPQLWRSDSIQFALAFAGKEKHAEIGVASRAADGAPLLHVTYAPAGVTVKAIAEAAELATAITPRGVRYDLAIPLAALDVDGAALRQPLGFSFVVNDADTAAGRESQASLTGGIGAAKDSAKFRLLRLEE